MVHLGLGAFFRAHGAVYTQEAAGGWRITGVSLRASGVRDMMAPRGYAYHAVETSAAGLRPMDVTVIRDVLVAPEDPKAVLDAMAAAETRIVSLTITEKGYCRAADALDVSHPDIQHDLAHTLPRSAPGYIVRALEQRWQAGLLPFTVMSLDNLPQNGPLTRRIILDLARQVNPGLADWIAAEARFPATMVDRIVPATTPEMIARLKDETGIDDPGAVFHEPFRQWVIEDSFVDDVRPDWAKSGAQLVDNVAPFEHMKLRMLNGTHSALAYIGCNAGHVTVADAIADPAIAAHVQAMWADEIAPGLNAPPGVDLSDYADALLARYRNPEIRHLLEQIAMDGSQKLPQRILDPLFENHQAGRPYRRLMTVVAAWITFLQRRAKTGGINDPLAGRLSEAVQADDTVAAVLAIEAIFGGYPVADIQDALRRLLS